MKFQRWGWVANGSQGALGVLAAACLVVFPSRVLGQTTVSGSLHAPEGQVQSSELVPAGEIHGILADAETGMPIAGGVIRSPDRSFGAMADSTGRFVIRGVDPGPHLLEAAFIGYSPVTVEVEPVDPQYGRVARFMLGRRYMGACGLAVGVGVSASVRDALTGAAPRGPIKLAVEQDTFHYETSTPVESIREHPHLVVPLRFLAAAPVQGTQRFQRLKIEVSAPGYATWSRDGIWLAFDECGFPKSPGAFTAWLLPLHSTDSAGPASSEGAF